MRKSKSGLVWIVEKPIKVNTYYGWGWDSSTGRMSLTNLSKTWAFRRMFFFVKHNTSKWWTISTVKTDLHRSFLATLAHKKRAKWDMARGAYVYKTKTGEEVVL